MSVLRAFKGYRPTAELCPKVAALPYDVMSSAEAREMVKGDPYSFLHVDRAEIDLDPSVDIYSPQVYQKAADNLKKMIDDGIYIQDKEPCMYIYRLTMDGRSQTGLVACASIDEYIENKIKKHELTREDKEQDRIRHVDTCNANTGPIFLTYRAKDDIDALIAAETAKNPVYDFVSDDGVGHTVWVISDKAVISALEGAFAKVPALYIADGHHRNASAVKVGLKRRGDGDYDKNAEFNFYLAVAFPDKQLHIMDYNRVVKDLNGRTKEQFLDEISKCFDVKKAEDGHPKKALDFGMYLDGAWYMLTAKSGSFDAADPVGSLDVSILQNNLLAPVLGIGDPRTDSRIAFVGGIRCLEELVRLVDSGKMAVAFAMYPTSVAQLMEIADAGKIMPPKSTWFEPKLRSGIFIHELS
ncbi:MAG: DUF1015 domain-containing protein [Firmicutes bacterium]|nr:DUF1015 domain-containing protein [Bacillota bacterium]